MADLIHLKKKQCPKCGRKVGVKNDGKFSPHKVKKGKNSSQCKV